MQATSNQPHVSFSERISLRMVVFGCVVLLLVGYPVYIFVHETVTGGVVDYGGFKKVDLKALSNFEMSQTDATIEDVPPQWRKLDGQKVLLEDEMWDPRDASGR